MRWFQILLTALLPVTLAIDAAAQTPAILEKGKYTKPGDFAFTRVSVIDGTGAAVRRDQTVIIQNGRIRFVGSSRDAKIPTGTRIIDLPGKTVIPGLIMMHEHLADPIYGPWLLLANGVTTARTGGTSRPFEDVTLKRWIEEGRVPGPELFLSSPWIQEPYERLARYPFDRIKVAHGEEDARRFVRYWASEGFHDIKVYRGLTPKILKVITREAHRHGLHVVGHIGETNCIEAAEAGIDSIEHGISYCLTQLKAADPNDPNSPEARALFAALIKHRVAVTETPVDLRPMTERELSVLHPGAVYEYHKKVREKALGPGSRRLNDEAQAEPGVEVAFYRAGGKLLLGSDSGPLQRLPGFMNLHSLVALNSAYGFSPPEAIKIATLDAATFLKIDGRTGSIALGKEADLAIVDGDPTERMSDVRNILWVSVNGVLHEPPKLLGHVRGKYLTP